MTERIAHLAVALDTGDWATFRGWCELFGGRVEVLKVGLEAFTSFGPRALEVAASSGSEVFLDLKLHDIPNTVEGAVRSIRNQGVRYLTVHSSGGAEMMRAASSAAGGELSILAVTVLTHLDRAALEELRIDGDPEERVVTWSRVATASGADGVVCSPLEARSVRTALGEGSVIVTPGIRLPKSSVDGPGGGDDQRRVATPQRARADGANLIVVGRPLTRAPNTEQALADFARALSEAE